MKFSLSKVQSLLRVHALADFINGRSIREKFLILGFGGLILLSLDYFLWLSPVIQTLTRTVPAYMATETELQNMRDDKKNETEIKARLEHLEAELTSKERRIEAADQIDALLEGLSKEATQSGVRITSLSPSEDGPRVTVGAYTSLPIDIKATAGTHELGDFLSRLEAGETAFKILNLKIIENAQNPKKHLVDIKVETYRKAGS